MAEAKSIGRLLRAARERVGLSQSALAQRVGIAANHLTRLENEEKSHPRFETVARLAVELGLSLDDLSSACGFSPSRRLTGSGAAASLAVLNELRALAKRLDQIRKATDMSITRLTRDVGVDEDVVSGRGRDVAARGRRRRR